MKLKRFERGHFFRSVYRYLQELAARDEDSNEELKLLLTGDPFSDSVPLPDDLIDLLNSFCNNDSPLQKEFNRIKKRKLPPLLSRLPLLLEEEEALVFYKRLLGHFGLKLLDESEEYRTIKTKAKLVSIGLKTHFIRKRELRLYEKRLTLPHCKLLFLNLTSTHGLFGGALKGKGINIFDVFVYSSDKEEKDIRESFTDLKKDLLYPEKSLTKRPKSHIIPALICSAILWGIVTASLLQIIIPLTLGGFFLAALPAVLYSFLKFILFSVSAKR